MPNVKRNRECDICGADDWRHRKGKGYDCNVCRRAHLEALTKSPEQILVGKARARARRHGIPCTITAADIRIPKVCPVLGIELKNGTRHSHGASPSLDRIDPMRGYVPGNVVVISHRANSIKGNARVPELRAVADWLEARKLEAYD